MPTMRTGVTHSLLSGLAGLFGAISLAVAAGGGADPGFPDLDVGYAPTPAAAIVHMFEMADVTADDVLVDLGSGDGRIPIAAVRERDVRRAIGIELDPWWPPVARERAREAGVAERVEFIEGDIFEQDFYHASVVTMYLLPELNLRLRPELLERMAPGSRVVSHTFDMGDWKPDEEAVIQRRRLLMWVIPAQIAGRWSLEQSGRDPLTLELEQRFQRFEGVATASDGHQQDVSGSLSGRTVYFEVSGQTYTGRVDEQGHMHGEGAHAWHAAPSVALTD